MSFRPLSGIKPDQSFVNGRENCIWLDCFRPLSGIKPDQYDMQLASMTHSMQGFRPLSGIKPDQSIVVAEPKNIQAELFPSPLGD